MSLIGVIRCSGSAVLFADSQETSGDPAERGESLKSEVNKIDRYYGPYMQLAYTAAANSGDLADRLSDYLAPMVRMDTSCPSTAEIHTQLISRASAFFASDEYRSYPGETDAKHVEALVCVAAPRCWPHRPVDVFRIANSTVRAVPDWHLSGIDYQFAKHLGQRRYRDGMTEGEATLLGLYLFKTVERISTWVGPPIRVVIARPTEIFPQDQELTELHLRHVTTIVEQLEEIVFAAPNLAEPDDAMTARWTATCDSMTALRGLFRQDVGDYAQRYRDKLLAERPINIKPGEDPFS